MSHVTAIRRPEMASRARRSPGAVRGRPWAATRLLLPVLVLVLSGLGLVGGTGLAATESDPEDVTRLRTGFVDSHFVSLNVTEAKATFRLFTESIARRRGVSIRSVAEVYTDTAELIRAVTNRGVDLVAVGAWEFVQHREVFEQGMEPMFVAAGPAGGRVEQVLLARRDGGIAGIADLRGKEVAVIRNSASTMARPWLESLVTSAELGNPEMFFARLQVVPKPQAAVLPVFFGRLPACVVDRGSWDVMIEMNPQVGDQLKAVARSEPFPDYVIAITRAEIGKPGNRALLVESLANLHRDPAGQQICTLFKFARMVPFETGFLDGIRALKRLHDGGTGRSESIVNRVDPGRIGGGMP